ncbi:hypothetical protein EFR21_01495 [Lactobacillus delbrueckii subsp. bulgaricus]|uniref:phage antirepressor n=1 Tax=Lactobacillus delbrueckii TaxID=1584 RepID=UPI0021A2EB67|nr:phage antirepressor KilAC domain-containing protein [Lactobacillus delbrueckii]MCT3465879.1 hypothetical protein [Lactobacillus delbrueckii subsp. bulgaricus]MCT3470840.1 hypothetical protein [Lactobacillus delbrueckii subsp. bulgaricus]
MDAEIQLFDFKGQHVRTLLIDEEPYFVGKDVAEVLGYKDLSRAVNQHVDREDRKSLSRKDSGDSLRSLWASDNDWTNKVVINESGVYTLIFNSQLPQAQVFKHWVTSEVLPSIRKYGAYATPETIESILANPDNGIKLLQALKDERSQKEQALLEASKEREARAIAEQKLSEAKPKLDYVDKILESKKTILTTHLATDYGCSAVAFNRMLCDKKIQRKVRDTYVLYSQYQGHGWTHTYARLIKTNHGQEIKEQMEWTQKGNIGLYELLKDRFGLLPEIERDYTKPYKIVTTKGKIEEVA